MDDTQTIDAVLKGDRERYAELVERYKKMVYAIAWSQLGDSDLSEDAAQETFVKAFCYLRTLRDRERFGCWLATIARNVCNAFHRKSSRESATAQRWAELQTSSRSTRDSQNSMEGSLSDSFASLSPSYREALTLFYVEGKSGREAADILGISEPAMKVRLHRARTALRSQLEARLENTLDGLAPTSRFTNSVMCLLPVTQSGIIGAGGIAGVIGKLGLSLWATLWMTAASALPAAGLIFWMTNLESRSIKNTPENQFRKNDIRQGARTTGLLILVMMLGGAVLTRHFGARTLDIVLCAYLLVSMWPLWRQLRVNRSGVALGLAFASGVTLAALASVGIWHVGYGYQIWIAAFIVLNVVTYFTFRNLPRRRDYNLFLRCATGGVADAASGPELGLSRLNDLQMKSFARFLGEQWLVRDYAIQGDAMVLILPDARPITARFFGGSRVFIDRTGECRASLGNVDRKGIDKIVANAPDRSTLEARVGRAVHTALAFFLSGDSDAARRILTVHADEEIFQPGAVAQGEKNRRILTVVNLAVLICLLAFHPKHSHHRPVRTEPAAARAGFVLK